MKKAEKILEFLINKIPIVGIIMLIIVIVLMNCDDSYLCMYLSERVVNAIDGWYVPTIALLGFLYSRNKKSLDKNIDLQVQEKKKETIDAEYELVTLKENPHG